MILFSLKNISVVFRTIETFGKMKRKIPEIFYHKCKVFRISILSSFKYLKY